MLGASAPAELGSRDGKLQGDGNQCGVAEPVMGGAKHCIALSGLGAVQGRTRLTAHSSFAGVHPQAAWMSHACCRHGCCQALIKPCISLYHPVKVHQPGSPMC